MPTVQSKLQLKAAEFAINYLPPPWIEFLLKLSKKKGQIFYYGFISVFIIILLKRVRNARNKRKLTAEEKKKRKNVPAVNWEFFRQMKTLIKLTIPSVWSSQFGILSLHSINLFLKTFLSIHVAKLEGRIVKEIVSRNVKGFVSLLSYWFMIAIPSCLLNSSIKFLENRLALSLRDRLVKHAYKYYFDNQVYYRVGNLDTRIPNPDHSLTEDISAFCESLAHLYSHIAKPLLDTLMVSISLYSNARKVQSNLMIGPIITISVVTLTGEILKRISPKFGLLVANEAEKKAKLRHYHSRIVTNSEEIAFYGGHEVEKKMLEESFESEKKMSMRIHLAKLWYIVVEQYLMKYAWAGAGMVVTAIPILTSRGLSTVEGKGSEADRTEYYLTTRNLLASGSDAIERLMTSYKEIVELAGYSSRVHRIFSVFDEVSKGKYVRETCVDLSLLKPGTVRENYNSVIELNNIKIVTPTGDVIVPELNLSIKPGMQVLITGSNGCGKSSLFRILSGLWPVYGGTLSRPPVSSLFYIPQRPYMSMGNLREQVIYPDSHKQMKSKGLTDKDLAQIMEKVSLSYIESREGGWDSIRDWQDVLSGGEKQRIGLARLFYQKPSYALLDECTSAVSMDVEDNIYRTIIDSGINLLTISHRPSLFKHHSHVLRFTGDGGWTFNEMDLSKELKEH